VRGRPRSSSEESRATGLPPGPRLRPNAAEKVSTAVVFGFSFCRYYQTHEPKFVELGSRSIGFLLRTRCLVLKEHHLTVQLTRPGPLRPDRAWAQKNRRLASQRPERSCGLVGRFWSLLAPLCSFPRCSASRGHAPSWACQRYIRSAPLSTSRTMRERPTRLLNNL